MRTIREVIRMLPESVKQPLRRLKSFALVLAYYGKGRLCPVCGKSSRRFRPYGVVPRKDAQCVHCGALERHRLLWLFLSKRTDLFNGKPKKMLHVAPEKCFEPRLKSLLGHNYLTADLFNPIAMIKMDITNIQYPDQSFDVIYCSHVLEHVQNDKQAMREFFRVLKKNGWAILLVPVNNEKTFEDPSITEPEERLKAFGQEDHVRIYGRDYVDRLREVGFTVKITKDSDLVTIEEMGSAPVGREIYYCTK